MVIALAKGCKARWKLLEHWDDEPEYFPSSTTATTTSIKSKRGKKATKECKERRAKILRKRFNWEVIDDGGYGTVPTPPHFDDRISNWQLWLNDMLGA
jgi:hypothetical protein